MCSVSENLKFIYGLSFCCPFEFVLPLKVVMITGKIGHTTAPSRSTS